MRHFKKEDCLKPVSISCPALSPDESTGIFHTLRDGDYRTWLFDTNTFAFRRLHINGTFIQYTGNDEILILQEEDGQSHILKMTLDGHKHTRLFTLPMTNIEVKSIDTSLYLITRTENVSKDNPYVFTQAPYRLDHYGIVHGQRSHIWLFHTDTGKLTKITDHTFDTHMTYYHQASGRLFFSGEDYSVQSGGQDTLYYLDEKGISRKICSFNGSIFDMCSTDELFYLAVGDLRENHFIYTLTPEDLRINCDCVLEGNLGWCLDTDIIPLGGPSFHVCNNKIMTIYADPSGARVCTYERGRFYPETPPHCQVSSFCSMKNGRIFAVCIADYWPMELCLLKKDYWIPITDFQKDLPVKKLGIPTVLDYHNHAGMEMRGWVLFPENYQRGKKYPGFLMIHEGPQGRYENIYHSDMQYLSSLGYFVFFTNPRGGTCVSRTFAELENRMGTIDFEDLMDFTDAVLENYPDINSKRLVVGGISYGGYMTNWIIGHTDRFHSAVSMSSISNWTSQYGASDIPYAVEYGCVSGKPWTNFESYWKSSPVSAASRAVTPTLFIHGGADYRCPSCQSEQMFAVLQKNHVKCRLIEFKNASHNFGYYGTPAMRLKRYDEIRRWLEETNL